MGAPEPHDFAVRVRAARQSAQPTSAAFRSTFVTIAIRPLCRRGVWAVNHYFRKKEIAIFLCEGLDNPNQIDTACEIGFCAQADRRDRHPLPWGKVDIIAGQRLQMHRRKTLWRHSSQADPCQRVLLCAPTVDAARRTINVAVLKQLCEEDSARKWPEADLVQPQLLCRLLGVGRIRYAQHKLFRT